jgi:hypothetical protein
VVDEEGEEGYGNEEKLDPGREKRERVSWGGVRSEGSIHRKVSWLES